MKQLSNLLDKNNIVPIIMVVLMFTAAIVISVFDLKI